MAEIVLRTQLSDLERLTAFVEQFANEAGVPADAAFQLNLALEEVVTNAITHGQAAAEAGVRVALARHGDVIEAEVIDGGAAFDPRTVAPPDLAAPLESRQVGGLGIHLVRQFVDELDYRRENAHNHLRLRKRLAPGGARRKA